MEGATINFACNIFSAGSQVTTIDVPLEEAQLAPLRQLAADHVTLLQGGAAFLGASVSESSLFAMEPVTAALQVWLASLGLHMIHMTYFLLLSP